MGRNASRLILGITLFVGLAVFVLYLPRTPGGEQEGPYDDEPSTPTPPRVAPIAAGVAKADGSTGETSATSKGGRVIASAAPVVNAALRVLDRVSRKPLANANITMANGDALGVTDSEGMLVYDRGDVDPVRTRLLATVREELGFTSILLDDGRRIGDFLVEATVPATARLEVRVTPVDVVRNTMIAAFELPPIRTDTEEFDTRVSSEIQESLRYLQSVRRAVPERFLKEYFAGAQRKKQYALVPRNDTKCFVLDFPFSGDVVVDILGPPTMRARRLVHVEQGQVAAIDAELDRMPTLSGLLKDSTGTALPKHMVRAFISSTADECQPLYVESGALDGVLIDREHHLSYYLETRSGTDGHFEFYLPFSDDVTLLAYDASLDQDPTGCVVRRKLASPTASADDFDLTLAMVPRRIRVQFTTTDGTPRSGGDAQVTRGSWNPNHSKHAWLTAPIDPNGWCDLSLVGLLDGDHYLVTTYGDGTHSVMDGLRSDAPELVDGKQLHLP